MACPYFYPLTKAEVDKQPARAPLGVLYRGQCEKGGTADREVCNFGYAARECDAFPLDAEADAVRFACLDGKLIYILEKNHSPVRYGDAGVLDGSLRRQAEVFQEWLKP
jgi:hypothetical protein